VPTAEFGIEKNRCWNGVHESLKISLVGVGERDRDGERF